jgi:hypothetical protein
VKWANQTTLAALLLRWENGHWRRAYRRCGMVAALMVGVVALDLIDRSCSERAAHDLFGFGCRLPIALMRTTLRSFDCTMNNVCPDMAAWWV